ncbi:shikimate dehydrogenase [Microcella alkalica]|uniref:shikimate dehydrogenase n=1 Tax=Microcella alkalica TaxID=355930 RepID=UPI001CB6FD5F|nr:shikimate dehydrogenase [Microcella alkalica]
MSIRRLAVVGSPIAHSLSPALHAAAYAALGLDWQYDRHEVREHELRGFVDGLDRSWRGLSATMPLKEELRRLADEEDRTVALTGAANTLLLADDGRRIVRNTDVAGVERALRDAGLGSAEHAVIAGAGATARSVLVALDAFGLRSVTVAVRDSARAGTLVALADELLLEVDLVALSDLAHVADGADVVAWTLPNGVELAGELPMDARREAVALDVTYHPWPGPLAAQWLAVGGRVASGRDMLLHQAVRQVRFFVSGQTEHPLPREAEVEAAMAAALA